MIIKVLLVGAAIAFGLWALRERVPGQQLLFRRTAAAIGTMVAIAAVLFPDSTSRVANFVGVGRGTDLLLYLLVLFFGTSVAITAQRIARLEREITILTRELALLNPLELETGDNQMSKGAAGEIRRCG